MSADQIDRLLDDAAPGARDAILERTLETWANHDAPAAARFAELQDDPFLQEAGLRTVARAWTLVDADAAARWAASIGDPALRRRVMDQVALVLADSNPRAALELLGRADDGRDPGDALTGVIVSWGSRDFAAARSWVEAQPAGAARDSLVQHLAFMRARTDPRMAMQLASELLSDEGARRDAYASLIGPWVERDGESAQAWITAADAETRRRVETELAIRTPGFPPD